MPPAGPLFREIFLFWWNRQPVAPIYNSQQVTQRAGDTSLPNDAGTYYLGHGWADETVWSKPDYKDLPLKLDDIMRRLPGPPGRV